MIYELFIHGIGNDKIRLDFGDNELTFKNTTIEEIKTKLIKEQALQAEKEHIRLIFAGKQLEDDKTISDCEIINKSTLMSVTRVPGGRLLKCDN